MKNIHLKYIKSHINYEYIYGEREREKKNTFLFIGVVKYMLDRLHILEEKKNTFLFHASKMHMKASPWDTFMEKLPKEYIARTLDSSSSNIQLM